MHKVIIILLACSTIILAQAWTHKDQAKWYDDFPECSLERQSPIEINPPDVIVAPSLPIVQFHNYSDESACPASMYNSGYSLSVDLSDECEKPQISGGPLPDGSVYEAVGYHFHWGSMDHHGSEHTVGAKRYSLELHIVHRNLKYSSVSEASNYPDGLAVQGLFYDTHPEDAADFPGLNVVVDSLSLVRNYGARTPITGIVLMDLFGSIDTSEYYTYPGSLTTPPCSQAVTWILYPTPILISHQQIDEFRALLDSNADPMTNNYRFIQPRGERRVYLRRSLVPPPADYDYTDYLGA